ncbi:MAG TPA: 2-amino-4-hydroxy-6-hydroxymethyldihydropteridine diphosphokinase [Opitutaceae bacterium]|nr:2-amino-4-hydroxy-6-hydroxymethyldihydropteridine diphosphokinase [Opitutaceae bacterium]
MKTAFLALGSNLEDRAGNLARALAALRDRSDGRLRVVKVSSIYQTAPVGPVEQPDFYNIAAQIETDFPPADLLTYCLSTEAELGRVRRERWGPRKIDIDLLSYEEERIISETLSLPHPRMLERSFVMIPLAEIAPRLVLEGESAASRAIGFGDRGIQRIGPVPGFSGAN